GRRQGPRRWPRPVRTAPRRTVAGRPLEDAGLLVGRRLGHEARAGRAVPAGLEGRAAEGVAQGLVVGRAPGAPVGEETEGPGEVAAGAAERVLQPGRARAVRGPDDHD